jgi:hypothetical protein
MGYRDDFYKVENIFGITGPVHELPTVYFKDAESGEYGHITQVHTFDWNAGRTEVSIDRGWTIVNKCTGGCGCGQNTAHEINGQGQCFHPSRNKFVSLEELLKLSESDHNVVEQAIWRCPYMKTDPMDNQERVNQSAIYEWNWNAAHSRGARTPTGRGRRGAIDYTASGLANRVYRIAYPNR